MAVNCGPHGGPGFGKTKWGCKCNGGQKSGLKIAEIFGGCCCIQGGSALLAEIRGGVYSKYIRDSWEYIYIYITVIYREKQK